MEVAVDNLETCARARGPVGLRLAFAVIIVALAVHCGGETTPPAPPPDDGGAGGGIEVVSPWKDAG